MSEVPQPAAELAAGLKPSSFLPGSAEAPDPEAEAPLAPVVGVDPSSLSPSKGPEAEAPFDPLRLCIFATISVLGWLFGPLAVIVFAGVGFVGYWQARKAGLTRSKCYLRDTRLVLVYLGLFLAAGVWGVMNFLMGWLA